MPIDFDYSNLDVDLEELDLLEDYISDGDVDTDRVFAEEEGEGADLSKNFDCVVVVDNLPKGVPQEKHEKLEAVIRKLFTGKVGDLQDDGLYLPSDADNKTLGFAFLAYKSVDSALQAIKVLDGIKLDSKHTCKLFPYTDLEKFATWPEQYQEPELPEYKPAANLKSWMMHPALRDQYLLRHGNNTEIYWCENAVMNAQPTLVYDGERERRNGKIWCEMYTAWSPQGSYLTTFHRQGIVLWGGDDFQRIRRFAHPGVQHILFSPNEKYVLTWNGVDDNTNARALIAWNVRTGKEIKCFKVDKQPDGEPAVWPVMKWGADDKYFARQIRDGISVFDASTGRLLEKKPIKAKNIREFYWSSSDNIIAYWAPEADNFPARVVLLDPETREEKRSKNLFNVREVKLHWQNAGDFLCAQVLRHTKSGKTTFTNFEFFRMRDNDIPNEMLSMKDMVEHFSWEPNRERFGIIHGESQHRLGISFYTAGSIKDGKKIELLYHIPNKAFNVLHWSPAGNNVIFAGSAISGEIEFWDVDEEVMTAAEEHFMCNEISWDPSGRMVATIVTQPMFGSVAMKYQLENGYNLWSFQGDSLRKEKMEHFYQFLWRPRPKTLLDEEEVQKVERGLKSYMARFGKEDEVRRKRLEAAANKEKISALQEFRELCEERHKEFLVAQAERVRLGLASPDDDDEYEVMDTTEEVFISEKVEPYF